MKNRKDFKDTDEAVNFLTTCKHFAYKHSYLNFSLEGNLFENGMHHAIRYFANVNRQYDHCMQNLSYVRLMTKWAKDVCNDEHSSPHLDIDLKDCLCKVDIVCRSSFNGAHCSVCELQ